MHSYWLKANKRPNTKVKTEIAVNTGQGLGSTKWKGCFSCLPKILFFKTIIIYLKKLKNFKMY